jgi:hypothetical protein
VMNMNRWNSVNNAVRKRTLRQYAPLMDFVGCACAPLFLFALNLFHFLELFQNFSPVFLGSRNSLPTR